MPDLGLTHIAFSVRDLDPDGNTLELSYGQDTEFTIAEAKASHK